MAIDTKELNDIMDRIDEAINSDPPKHDKGGVLNDANIWAMGIFDLQYIEPERNWLFRIILKIKRLFKWQ